MSRVKIIKEKMLQLGYEASEIIHIDQLDGFEERFYQRMASSPMAEQFYENHKRLVEVKKNFPWAKSILVAYSDFSHYEVPKTLRGRIGRAYLFDARVDKNAVEHHWQLAAESFLDDLGIQQASYHKFGLVPMRYVAEMAGIGHVGFNNFFYGRTGSYVHLVAWVLDEVVEPKVSTLESSCPQNCNRCIAACPTKALDQPYGFNPMKCISFLTTFGGRDLEREPLAQTFKKCVYGCDICQEVCPKNKEAHRGEDQFPNLKELEPLLTNKRMLSMSQEQYVEKIQPKFFYLGPDELWKWQINILSEIDRNFSPSQAELLKEAFPFMTNQAQEMAKNILKRHEVDSRSLV